MHRRPRSRQETVRLLVTVPVVYALLVWLDMALLGKSLVQAIVFVTFMFLWGLYFPQVQDALLKRLDLGTSETLDPPGTPVGAPRQVQPLSDVISAVVRRDPPPA